MEFKRTGNLLVFGLALAVSAGTAFSDDASSQPSAQGLTQRLHDLHAQYRQSDPSTQPQALESLKLLAKSRKQTLVALMETDPGEVLRQAVPASVRASLPADVQADVEEETDLEGVVEILHEDWPGGGRYRHFLDTHKGRFSLHFAGPLPDLLSGDRVRVRGVRVERALALDAGTGASVQTLAAIAPNTFGTQKTVVLLVNFLNDTSQPYTIEYAQNVLSMTADFYRENSYQQTSIIGDVFGWFTLPIGNSVCDLFGIMSEAENAATASGINLSSYSRRVYAFPRTSNCAFSGAAVVGGNPSASWINGVIGLRVLGHELGHNFGLYHSHSLNCAGVVLAAACTSVEYGDAFDIMGGSTGHFNAYQKWRLGWLDYHVSPPITTVQTSGTYPLDPYESPGSAPKALKIPRGTSGDAFFVEFRRPIGFDSALSSTGVVVHLTNESDPNGDFLLDMNPDTSWLSDAVLDVGKTFSDPFSPITITPSSVGSTTAAVTVNLGSACARAKPILVASPPQSAGVQAGTTVVYTVSVTNADSGPCPASTFSLQATAPAGWQKAFSLPSVTLSPGATASTTLQVTSVPAPAGSYSIVGTAANTAVSAETASTTVKYMLASGGDGPACTPSKPTVTATPAKSPAVQAGTTVTYTVSVKNNDSSSCTASGFGLQATAPAGWQSIFASPSLTVAPGATGTTTLKVTSVPSPAGSYPIVGTATKAGTPSGTASASMTYTLASGPRGPGGGTGTFSDDFNRPDAPTLGNGWTSTNWSIKADPQTGQQRARSVAATKPASSVAVAPLSGATQTVSADFTPTDLTGERFCLLLRWTAAGGYMACRAPGGSGFLRLIRVSGGTETILRQASLGNPVKGVPFTLTATISGNTFSMGAGAIKVPPVNTATDLTPGSVGMRLDAGSAPTSHAADNFKATAQ